MSTLIASALHHHDSAELNPALKWQYNIILTSSPIIEITNILFTYTAVKCTSWTCLVHTPLGYLSLHMIYQHAGAQGESNLCTMNFEFTAVVYITVLSFLCVYDKVLSLGRSQSCLRVYMCVREMHGNREPHRGFPQGNSLSRSALYKYGKRGSHAYTFAAVV